MLSNLQCNTSSQSNSYQNQDEILIQQSILKDKLAKAEEEKKRVSETMKMINDSNEKEKLQQAYIEK